SCSRTSRKSFESWPAKASGSITKAGLTIQPGRKAKRLLLSNPLHTFGRLTVKNLPPRCFHDTVLDDCEANYTTTIVKITSCAHHGDQYGLDALVMPLLSFVSGERLEPRVRLGRFGFLLL